MDFLTYIILLLALNTETQSSQCISETCTGPFKMEKQSEITLRNHKHMELGILTTIVGEAKAITIEKIRYRLYCYNGGSLDPNTRCEGGLQPIKATEEEMRRKGCMIGRVPEKVDDFWGSDAAICFEEDTIFASNKVPKYFNWRGHVPFASHLCVQDWKCQVKEHSMPVFLTESGMITFGSDNKEINLGLFSVTGNELRINPYVHYDERGFTTQISLTTEKREQPVKMECFGNGRSYLCLIYEGEGDIDAIKGQAIVFEENSKTAYYKNNMIVRSGVKDNPNLKHHKNPSLYSSSIEDLKMVANSLSFSIEEGHYNTELLNVRLNLLYNAVITIIHSVGKVDDELVPNILEKKGKTKWLNDKIFNICPCYDAKITEETNCNNGFIYVDGRMRRIKDNDKCVKFNIEQVKPLGFDLKETISIAELLFPPPGGTAVNWDGWSWVNDKKEEMISASVFHQQYASNSTTLLGQIANLGSFNIMTGIGFFFSTSALCVLNTIMIACLIWNCCTSRVYHH